VPLGAVDPAEDEDGVEGATGVAEGPPAAAHAEDEPAKSVPAATKKATSARLAKAGRDTGELPHGRWARPF
jgi:hypothetical protein